MSPPSDPDGSLPRVRPVDLADYSPGDFRDDELDLPYYLAHVHRVANAVRSDDPRGFVDLSVWRGEDDNEPYNARVMENCLSLSFFYATDRPWNPYHGDDAMRARLEAALSFWTGLQDEDGRFSEYGPGEWNLAATAFATKFVGGALVCLDDGPPIDADLRERVADALRRAIHVTLTDEALFEHGRSYTNQFSNVWAGAGAYLSLHDDDEIRRLLADRLEDSRDAFQSPAGYFYENDGPDWTYSLKTHHSNLRMAHHYLAGTDLDPLLVEKERRWADWMAYGAVLEPGAGVGSDGDENGDGDGDEDRGFVLNRGGDTRLLRRAFDRHETPLAADVPAARAFAPTDGECREWIDRRRERLEAAWPAVEDLPVGEFGAFSPYAVLHRDHDVHYPDADARAAARADLPYLAAERFVHRRVDDRTGFAATYVRRPAYYAAFDAAPEARGHQRLGLALVWHPDAGAVLQTGAGRRGAAFGTRSDEEGLPYEAGGVDATCRLDGRVLDDDPGVRDVADAGRGRLRIDYPLGDAGGKTVTFGEDGVELAVDHPGAFVETVPLLAPPDAVERTDDGLAVRFDDVTLSLTTGDVEACGAFDTGVDVPAPPISDSVRLVERAAAGLPEKRLLVVRLHAVDGLTYALSFDRH